jgi:hypothetical protein
MCMCLDINSPRLWTMYKYVHTDDFIFEIVTSRWNNPQIVEFNPLNKEWLVRKRRARAIAYLPYLGVIVFLRDYYSSNVILCWLVVAVFKANVLLSTARQKKTEA